MRLSVNEMGTRYLALLWPFVALGAICVLRLLPRSSVLVTVLVVSLVVMPMSIGGLIVGRRGDRALAPPAGTQAIVFDNDQRTVLPRSLWSVPDDTLVFAGSQAQLLAHSGAWLQRLCPGDLLFTTTRRGGTQRKSAALVALLDLHCQIVPYVGTPLVPGDGYRIVQALAR